MLAVIMDSVELPYEVESIDIDEQSELAMKYRVRGVPTLILVDDSGNEIKRNVGMITREKLLEWVK
jgi:thioredoxin 1